LTKLYNAARELESQLGRPPTPAEIGEAVGTDADKVQEAFRAAKVPISLETPIGEDEGSTLADLVADVAGRSPSDEAEEGVLAQAVDQSLRANLTPREVDVMRLRYGLSDGQERTLAEVGRALGMSRERARQIEAEAIRKLRRAGTFRTQFQEYAG
jgi:RNA polymerase primary sigma factor